MVTVKKMTEIHAKSKRMQRGRREFNRVLDCSLRDFDSVNMVAGYVLQTGEIEVDFGKTSGKTILTRGYYQLYLRAGRAKCSNKICDDARRDMRYTTTCAGL